MIWGECPSQTAVFALQLFQQNDVKTILVPGSGYGRNTKLYSQAGFEVTGIEISPVAYAMARKFDPLSRFYNASSIDMSFDKEKYQAIYCFNVLHLFCEHERRLFLQQCIDKANTGGFMFFTVFSEIEPSYGKGKKIERNTFESKPGRPVHYFTESDLRDHFEGMEIIATGIMEDSENHGGEAHTHILRYIYLNC